MSKCTPLYSVCTAVPASSDEGLACGDGDDGVDDAPGSR